MKRLLFAGLLALLATPALAQNIGLWPLKPLTQYQIFLSHGGTGPLVGTATVAIAPGTRYVRAICTTSCWVAFQVTPIVAGASAPSFLPQLREEYFRVSPGAHVTAIRATSQTSPQAFIFITEME